METAPSGPKKSKPTNDTPDSARGSYLRYSGLGIQMVGTIGLCAWLGHLLDKRLAFQFPVFLLSFVMIAFLGNMVLLYRSVNKS